MRHPYYYALIIGKIIVAKSFSEENLSQEKKRLEGIGFTVEIKKIKCSSGYLLLDKVF